VTDQHLDAPRRRDFTLLATLSLVAVALLAAACGSSTKSATTSSTTTAPAGSAARTAAFAKYTSCLESHGVPSSVASQTFGFGRRNSTSSTTTGGAGASTSRPTIPSQYQAAYTTCRSDLPTGGFGGRGNFNGANSAQLEAYRNCLTIHGVALPTTVPGSQGSGGGFGGGGFGGGGGFSSSPAFKAAQQACASLLPARPSTGSTTTVPAAS
jgi:hypothetical protein